MKIVLCNGDSLGMPRENVSFKHSWYFKLAEEYASKNYFFVNNFRRAFNTLNLGSKDFLENYHPDIVILQVGIVDCAPRLFKSNSLSIKIINRIPFISKIFWHLIKKYKERKSSNADVPLELFRKNLFDYLKRCEMHNLEQCILIKIETPGIAMIEKNPGILEAVKKYNKVFDEVSINFRFVTVISPLLDGNDEYYLEDGYHLNQMGFQKVFEDLERVFNEQK